MISYRKRKHYKYVLDANYHLPTPICPPQRIELVPVLILDTTGELTIKAGYAWDGITGVPDLNSMLLPSLVHDALYQLMREGHLPQSARTYADELFRDLCRERTYPWLAQLAYHVVNLFGARYATSDLKKAP
ncbi:MAG: hypothetical protein VXW65_05350 [Pseudomonadota bacterium]|nr:hypothetical protein [Pseudomonadota bacterium]